MLDENILKQIRSGQITSRRQLYARVGRSKELRLWLDDQSLLIPTHWNEQRIIQKMRDFYEIKGRLPIASDDWDFARAVQNHFGSWNNGLFAAFGTYNQRRYDMFSNEELIEFIDDYIRKFGHYPLREEFDGRTYPYWEVYFSRFGVHRWSDVLGMAIESKYPRFGWGKRYEFDGKIFLSRQELLIGKWLVENNIAYDKEVPYSSGSRHVFDFYLPELNVYIEYYGIGTEDYLARVEEKRKHYYGRKVIEIFKHDNTIKKLSLEVQRLQSPPELGMV